MTPDFTPTRAAGLARLEAFTPSMGAHYAAQRNFDLGPDNRSNVSALSPWISHRLITEREAAAAAIDRHGLRAADKFIAEVCWRAYFKGWLEHRPQVWTDYAEDLSKALADVDTNSGLRTAYTEAIEGRTGIAGFDDWARELVEHGYLANHARMWFASIWIFTLKLPWQLGADFFLRHLIDADAGSNTLSWRWVGGLHTPGKTYLARRSNIEKYTNGRVSPAGLSSEAPALTGSANGPVGVLRPGHDMPTGTLALLLTEEDLSLTDLVGEYTKVQALAAAQFAHKRSPNGAGDVAAAFTRSAVEDAASRTGQTLGLTPVVAAGDDALDQLTDWARASGASTVVTGFAPVGWVRPELDDLRGRLASHDIRLLYVDRPWDRAFWPHAKKGFFGLKKKIPDTLRALSFGV